MAKIDPELLTEIHKHCYAGNISARTMDNLTIYNYTNKCQYDWVWTPATITCRGLILDDKNNIVARPFKKFFTREQYLFLGNMDELYGMSFDNLFDCDFYVTEKYDGALIVMSVYDNKLVISSRGSFTSPQARKARELAQNFKAEELAPNLTYLFEIIYPENSIETPLVVDYGDKEELRLLAVIDNETGADIDYVWPYDTPIAKQYDNSDLSDLFSHDEPGREGYVIRFVPSNIRVKIKFDSYCDLQRLINNTTKKQIWQKLYNKESISCESAPLHIQRQICQHYIELSLEFQKVELAASALLEDGVSKKELALKYTTEPNKSLLPVAFAMLDNKPDVVERLIWKRVKPVSLNNILNPENNQPNEVSE